MRNWSRMSRCRAPSALRRPISRVRSRTETSMMFETPTPPTSSEIAAMAASTGEQPEDPPDRAEDLGLGDRGELLAGVLVVQRRDQPSLAVELFHLLHKEGKEGGKVKPCLRRIQMKTHCPEHGEIARADTVRGFEWSKGQYVVIDEKDLEAVPLKTVRAIEIEQFVEAERDEFAHHLRQAGVLPRARAGRSQGVLPAQGRARRERPPGHLQDRAQGPRAARGARPVSARRCSSRRSTGRTRCATWASSTCPSEEFDFKPAEIQMAKQLVQAMTGEFDASQYRDEYREALIGRHPVQDRGPAAARASADARAEQADRPDGRPGSERGGRSRGEAGSRRRRRGEAGQACRLRQVRACERTLRRSRPRSLEARKARAKKPAAAAATRTERKRKTA